MIMFACAISNSVDKRYKAERESLYMSCVAKYTREEMQVFPKIFGEIVKQIEDNPEQDLLGDLYMQLDLGSHWHGQFFTPYNVCAMMANMEYHKVESADEVKPVTASDCACGGGALLIAAAHAYRKSIAHTGLNPQHYLCLYAQDLSRTTAMMCYIQLSLQGYAGKVKVGQDVVIMTDATGEDEFNGKVTFIAPTATAPQSGATSTSNTFEVKIDITNKDDRLRLGMSAKLNILVDQHKNVLAVPYDAIEEKDGGKTVIYVVDNNAKPDEKKNGNTSGIKVIGLDVELPTSTDNAAKTNMLAGKDNAREIPVQIGLESDYYTEVISPDIYEGMTVLVNSTAGEIKNDMDFFMGP